MISDETTLNNLRLGLLGLGGVSTGAAAYQFYRSERLTKSGTSTKAIVTRLEWRPSSFNDNAVDTGDYAPEFTFESGDGAKHVVVSKFGSSPCPYAVGQEISVLYDPANPGDAEVNSFGTLWVLPGILGLVGIVMMSVGIGLYLAPYFQN